MTKSRPGRPATFNYTSIVKNLAAGKKVSLTAAKHPKYENDLNRLRNTVGQTLRAYMNDGRWEKLTGTKIEAHQWLATKVEDDRVRFWIDG